MSRKHEDWFDENNSVLTDAVHKHRRLLRQPATIRWWDSNNTEIRQSALKLRKLAREVKDKWWHDKACQMQWLADTNQLVAYYKILRTIKSGL